MKSGILSKAIDFLHKICYYNLYIMPTGQFFFGGNMDDGDGNTCQMSSVNNRYIQA